MKGSIYTSQRCELCDGVLRHDGNKDGFVCQNHPDEIIIPKICRVKFGRTVSKTFNNHKYTEARQFLEGLRFKTVEGSFDHRDYMSGHPMGFGTQALKWLKHKEKNVSKNYYRDIQKDIHKAIAVWGQTNVKNIGKAEIEDFLDDLDLSSKSRANAQSCLHSFFTWLCDREDNIPMPKFPEVKFELGWRAIVSIEDQQSIISEVKKISWDINPKIWIGIKWLATYPAFRPNELRMLKESEINVSGFFVVPKPKEKKPKLIAMLPEDIELYKTYRGMPDLYFFRHIKGNGAANPGQQFGKDYLYKWWKKACDNLGVKGIDLYGGTRHSTATALSEHFSEQEIMDAGTIHKSNKAARRYIQAKRNSSIAIYEKVQELQSGSKVVPFRETGKK